jgi:hypothetical protein
VEPPVGIEPTTNVRDALGAALSLVEHIVSITPMRTALGSEDDTIRWKQPHAPLPKNAGASNNVSGVHARLVYWAQQWASVIHVQPPGPAHRAWRNARPGPTSSPSTKACAHPGGVRRRSNATQRRHGSGPTVLVGTVHLKYQRVKSNEIHEGAGLVRESAAVRPSTSPCGHHARRLALPRSSVHETPMRRLRPMGEAGGPQTDPELGDNEGARSGTGPVDCGRRRRTTNSGPVTRRGA